MSVRVCVNKNEGEITFFCIEETKMIKILVIRHKHRTFASSNTTHNMETRTLLYLHGFASAGNNGTSVHLRNSLYEHGIQVISPDLPVMPLEAMEFLKNLIDELKPELIVGTSMGAFYAEQFRGYKRILVNPGFHLARLLTFKGMGKREFRNKREDGAKEFKVDKEMINQYKAVESNSFKGITAEEKKLVWGLFGLQDKNVNCQPDFLKHYGKTQFITYEGDHYLNDTALKKTVYPLIKELLNI